MGDPALPLAMAGRHRLYAHCTLHSRFNCGFQRSPFNKPNFATKLYVCII